MTSLVPKTSSFVLDSKTYFSIIKLISCFQEPDTTCLADYCDIFRCDVISAQYAADYWTKALCKEDELIGLKKTCHVGGHI